jgi:DNA-binding NarL/FixJ family response regulator
MPIPPPIPQSSREQKLESLERDIVRGQRALTERNRLVVELVAAGYTQADVTRRLNRQRAALSADLLTPDAVHAILKRTANKEPNK